MVWHNIMMDKGAIRYAPPIVEIWCTQQRLQELCIQIRHRKRTRQDTVQLRNMQEKNETWYKKKQHKKQNGTKQHTGPEQDKTNRERSKHAWHKKKTRQEIEKNKTAYWVKTRQETENKIQEKIQE